LQQVLFQGLLEMLNIFFGYDVAHLQSMKQRSI
jgi:hypothetical protein